MIARSNLGHNSPMFFMLGDLRGDFARQQFMSAQDRDGCLIARGFEREDCFHLNRETRAVASHFSRTARRPSSKSFLYCFAPRRVLLRVNHYTLQRFDRSQRLWIFGLKTFFL